MAHQPQPMPPYLLEGAQFEQEYFPECKKNFNETMCKNPCSAERKALGDCFCNHVFHQKIHGGMDAVIDHVTYTESKVDTNVTPSKYVK